MKRKRRKRRKRRKKMKRRGWDYNDLE